MAVFIHNNMIGEISQITIDSVATPEDSTALFQFNSSSDELFLPIVQANNISVESTNIGNLTTIGENSVGNVSTSSSGGGSGGGYGGY